MLELREDVCVVCGEVFEENCYECYECLQREAEEDMVAELWAEEQETGFVAVEVECTEAELDMVAEMWADEQDCPAQLVVDESEADVWDDVIVPQSSLVAEVAKAEELLPF